MGTKHEVFEVIREGQMFAVKVTYESGNTELKRRCATQAEAEAWIANHWAARAARISRKNRSRDQGGRITAPTS